MPPLLVPHRSGIHRTACFALFRALLRQKSRLPIDERERLSLHWTLRAAFKKNASLTSHRKTAGALHLGYQALRIFKRIDKHPDKLRQIFDFIAAPKPCMPPVLKDASQDAAEQTSRGRRPKSPRPPPRVWPHPNNKPVLSRPFPTLTSRRHVPKLFVGNQVPFLMIKKPQSTYLGRIIRDQIDARQKRILRRDRLKDQILIERMEDEWDKIVESNCGISFMGEGSWAEESVKAMAGLLKVVRRNDDRTLITAGKMQEIVEKEQALADMEKIQRRKEKKRMRLARKDAGCGKEKWTRRTGKMQDVASTLPCTEIVQPNESGHHGWTL